jgi:hypothetical protein
MLNSLKVRPTTLLPIFQILAAKLKFAGLGGRPAHQKELFEKVGYASGR